MIVQPQTMYVSLDKVQPPSHRLRESISEERLGELADSMAAEGLHQPIGLRGPFADHHYEVVWGDRRALAARR
jgi:ParB-like chromosome segregation protein Spo0J